MRAGARLTSNRSIGAAILAAMILIPAGAAGAVETGSGCCDDLEERIAALEATTARKGATKVSLTVSGMVLRELTYWDDGGETNTYLHGVASQSPHFKFGGEATLAPGWSAAFLLRLQDFTDYTFLRLPDGQGINQVSDERDFGLNVHMFYWQLKSKDYGTLSVGRMSHAAKSAAMQTDQSGTQVFDNYTFLSGLPQFVIRSGGDLEPFALTWAEISFCYAQAAPLGGDCDGVAQEGVRYDSPALKGLTLSASWGADDFWEAAARYAGETGGLKLAFGAGFTHMTDEGTIGPPVMAHKNSDYAQAGGYVQHLATGLFVHGAWGFEDNHATLLNNGFTTKDGEHWTVKAGIRRNWIGLGATVLYGDYSEYLDQLGPEALALGATASKLTRFGGGLAQEIDPAAMTVYLKYQRYVADISGASLDGAVANLDAIDFVSVGSLIAF